MFNKIVIVMPKIFPQVKLEIRTLILYSNNYYVKNNTSFIELIQTFTLKLNNFTKCVL